MRGSPEDGGSVPTRVRHFPCSLTDQHHLKASTLSGRRWKSCRHQSAPCSSQTQPRKPRWCQQEPRRFLPKLATFFFFFNIVSAFKFHLQMFAPLITSKTGAWHLSTCISSLWYNLIKSHARPGCHLKEAKCPQIPWSHAQPSWKLANYLVP